MKLKSIYRLASTTAFLMIMFFMTSSLLSEFIGDPRIIASVKKTIFYSLPMLIVCMISTAISSKKMAALYPNLPYDLVRTKRIKLISLNGIVSLAPLATTLNYFAQHSRLDSTFYLLQILEIICGAINIYLLSKIIIDEKKVDRNVN